MLLTSEEIGLRVFIGKQSASASSSDLSSQAMETLAERAVAMARLAPEDPYAGLAPEDRLARGPFPDLDLILIESGGDNLAATYSPELADLTIYVIDTAAGQDIPRKRGPGVTRSDRLVVNKTDLAPYVGVDPVLLEADTARARGTRPYVMARLRQGDGLDQVVAFLQREGGLALTDPKQPG